MTPDARTKLRKLLLKHEGLKLELYTDTTGHVSIGCGRNLSTRGISENEAFYLLDEDILYFMTKLNSLLPWFNALDENRQVALVDLAFNLGMNGLLSFKKMLAAFADKDYQRAASELLNSKYARQVGQRAEDLAEIVRSGEL